MVPLLHFLLSHFPVTILSGIIILRAVLPCKFLPRTIYSWISTQLFPKIIISGTIHPQNNLYIFTFSQFFSQSSIFQMFLEKCSTVAQWQFFPETFLSGKIMFRNISSKIILSGTILPRDNISLDNSSKKGQLYKDNSIRDIFSQDNFFTSLSLFF